MFTGNKIDVHNLMDLGYPYENMDDLQSDDLAMYGQELYLNPAHQTYDETMGLISTVGAMGYDTENNTMMVSKVLHSCS